MKIATYSALVALWTEYELGEARNVRPKGFRKGQALVGLTLAAQGHRAVESRPGYAELRADLQERYVLLISPVYQAQKLDAWEAEFDADLLREPVLLVPPGAPVNTGDLSEEDRARIDQANEELERLLKGRRSVSTVRERNEEWDKRRKVA